MGRKEFLLIPGSPSRAEKTPSGARADRSFRGTDELSSPVVRSSPGPTPRPPMPRRVLRASILYRLIGGSPYFTLR